MEIIYILHLFLPAYFANSSAVVFGGGKPLDFGRYFIDGRRILGNGVTIRGTIFGSLAGFLLGLFAYHIYENPLLKNVNIYLLSFLLSFGALLGDAIGSFIKRRLGIERGKPAPLLDQLDFVFGAVLLSSFIYEYTAKIILTLVVVTPVLHLLANVVGYILKLKDVPW